MTNDELALQVALNMEWEEAPNLLDLSEFARRYDAAKLEAMQPEVKEMVDMLRNRGTVYSELNEAADLIERLSTTQEKK